MRALYVDVPFENESGGDKNRSRFLWEKLTGGMTVDFVVLTTRSADHAPSSIVPVAVYSPQKAGPLQPSGIPNFSDGDRAHFADLVARGEYDVIIARFCTAYHLLAAAQARCPHVAVVVDVDMLESRLVRLSWEANPSFQRRWFFIERHKLQFFERQLFRKPWTFLFTNDKERQMAEDAVSATERSGTFVLVPNPMTGERAEAEVTPRKVVLFFGSLDSAANIDGTKFLLEEVFPLISPELESQNAELLIVGKNPYPALSAAAEKLRPRVRVKAGVPSMAAEIAKAAMVLLPLRIASGTRTRILEAALQRRPVVTTSIGVEGLELSDGVLVGDTAPALAAHVHHLLRNPERREQLGEALWQSARERYSGVTVGGQLLNAVLDATRKRKDGQQTGSQSKT